MNENTGSTNFRLKNRATFLNRKELAAALGVSPRIVTELTKEHCPVTYVGKLKKVGRGSHPRYDLEEVKKWLRERTLSARR